MGNKTIAVNSYLGALLITIVAGGATMLITNFANSVAFAEYAIVDPDLTPVLAE